MTKDKSENNRSDYTPPSEQKRAVKCVKDPVVKRIGDEGLFGKMLPTVEEIQGKAGDCATTIHQKDEKIQEKAGACSAALDKKLANVLADQLIKHAHEMDKNSLRLAFRSLLKVGGQEDALVLIYSYAHLAPDISMKDFKMFLDYLKKNPDACLEANKVAKENINKIVVFACSIDSANENASRVEAIVNALGHVKDPAAIDAIVSIYEATNKIFDTNNNNIDVTGCKESIKLACIDAIANIDTEESFEALEKFSKKACASVYRRIIEVISKKLGV